MTKSLLNTHVVNEVRVEMARQRLTQRELAERLGLSQAQISERMCGTVPLRLPELEAIAGVLGVSPAKFLPEPAIAS